ncbi:CYTH domain-containing protein [Flavobacteriaceae bacterium]|nr:CYTH domain-containing protein [Flavobacteriaceae bacterium]MDB9954401.1 CYTH domain-containing protein [Flavobacteriaceae bacterium]MDC1265668.1 CYTH domain-containing protein [Flavobacteriaceae bacterium]
MIEIERKFLLSSEDYRKEASSIITMTQGYLNSDPERSVRIRLTDQSGFITVKGKSNESGLSRFEWEKEISKTDAEALLKLCEKTIISKTRYEVAVGNHLFEVDEFLGDNKGLVMAEVELGSEDEKFSKPDWLGEEVTGDLKYYNSNLSNAPFCNWK